MINYSTFAKLRGIKHSMEHAILKYNEHTLELFKWMNYKKSQKLPPYFKISI